VDDRIRLGLGDRFTDSDGIEPIDYDRLSAHRLDGTCRDLARRRPCYLVATSH
jgi:hypothetical protein